MWIFVFFHSVNTGPDWAVRDRGLEFCQGSRIAFRSDLDTPIWQVGDPPGDSQFSRSPQREPPKPYSLDPPGDEEVGSGALPVRFIPRHGR